MLKVRLFGAGQAQYFDRFLVGFPEQQGCPILCYLLLNRNHPHHREKLASVFWGDLSNDISRKNLRNNLWRLRRTLQSVGAIAEDYLLINEESISFIPSGGYWLDIEVFENASIEVQAVDGADLTKNQVENLEGVLNLYSGDLLESNYDDWCIYDRERYRLMYLNNLNKLLVYHGKYGNYEQGCDLANRILAMDHAYELVHRQLMWMHWQSGNRNAAIAQYKQCVQIMHDELGVPPMEETQRLYKLIQAGEKPISYQPEFVQKASIIDSGNNKLFPTTLVDIMAKLNHLQLAIDQTRSELVQIERILHDALSHPDSI